MKAHLEINLATVVRVNKNIFTNTLTERVPRMWKRLRLLMFAFVFNSQISYPHDIQPLELEDRDGEQNEPG